MSSDSNRLNIEVRVPLWAILYAPQTATSICLCGWDKERQP